MTVEPFEDLAVVNGNMLLEREGKVCCKLLLLLYDSVTMVSQFFLGKSV